MPQVLLSTGFKPPVMTKVPLSRWIAQLSLEKEVKLLMSWQTYITGNSRLKFVCNDSVPSSEIISTVSGE